MRPLAESILGRLQEDNTEELHLDLIGKAMNTLKIPERDWDVTVTRDKPKFVGRVYLSNKEAMRRAMQGMKVLGYQISTPDYSHYNFIVQGEINPALLQRMH